MNRQIRETITHVGQAYKDEPVFEEISRAQRSALEVHGAVSEMAQRREPFPIGVCRMPAPPPSIHEQLRAAFSAGPRMPQRMPLQPMIRQATGQHRRVRLNWLTPDGKGGLVPRK